MNYLKILLLPITLSLTSCFSNRYEFVGEKEVKGSQKMYFKIYQKDAFEHYTPLQFELFNDDTILIPRRYLTGTDVSNEKIDRFYAGLQDSTFYICYPYPKVYFIQHLDSSKSYLSRDSLFKELKKHDDKLIDSEKQ